MKNVLIIKYKEGHIKKVRWGNLPDEWHEPFYFHLGGDYGIDSSCFSSTMGNRTFTLHAIEIKGFWFWKARYGHYEEK